MTFSEMLSIVVEHDASATQAISKATTRVIIGLGQLERGTARVGNGWNTVDRKCLRPRCAAGMGNQEAATAAV